MKKLKRSLTAAAFIASASVVLLGCTAAETSTDTAVDEAPPPAEVEADFWAGYVEPTIPAEAGVDVMVDTSEYKIDEERELVIGYSDASLGNSWRIMAKAETEYGISQLPNARLVYTNADDSVPKQIADIDDMIAQKVDAIIIAAVDVNALCPTIDKSLAAGIPVVIQERLVNCENYTSFVSTTTAEVGINHMEYIAQRLGGEGKIAIVSGIAGVGHSVAMEDYYALVLKDYPGIDVVATEYAEYDPAKAQEVTSALLTAHPDIQAIASISGNITIGVFKAVQAAGKLDQMVAWTGDDANGWMLIQAENNLPGMTVPLPPKAGRDSVAVAAMILAGESVPSTYPVVKLASAVDFSRNIAEYANADRSDEWWGTDLPCEFDPFCK